MASVAPSKRRRIDSVNLDKLSRLPTELIHLILKRVPIKDAVRTSALSRFWRNRWMDLPYLVFDSRSILHSTGWQLTKPLDIINNVLLLHDGTIHRFEICNFLDCCSPDIDRWMCLLARKQVNELVLDFPSGTRYKVTSSLLSCQSLRVLQLSRCVWTMPPRAEGFDNLVELQLVKVMLTDEVLSSLTYPTSLRSLNLIKCYGFDTLNIYAPCLQTFQIQGPCASIIFLYTPKLKVANMGLLPDDLGDFLLAHNAIHPLKHVLCGLVNAEKIIVSKYFMKILGACIVPRRSSIVFQCLHDLTLTINLKVPGEMCAALWLFESTACLQSITIENYFGGQLPNSNEDSLQLELQLKALSFPKLETVVFTGFMGESHELRLVQFILLNAVVLKIMNIEWHVNVQDPWRSEILENMMQFERASPRAKVVFARHA